MMVVILSFRIFNLASCDNQMKLDLLSICIPGFVLVISTLFPCCKNKRWYGKEWQSININFTQTSNNKTYLPRHMTKYIDTYINMFVYKYKMGLKTLCNTFTPRCNADNYRGLFYRANIVHTYMSTVGIWNCPLLAPGASSIITIEFCTQWHFTDDVITFELPRIIFLWNHNQEEVSHPQSILISIAENGR